MINAEVVAVKGVWCWRRVPENPLAAVTSVRACEMVKQKNGRSQLCSTCCDPLAIFWSQGGKGLEAYPDTRDALVGACANPCRETSLAGLGTHTHTKDITIDDDSDTSFLLRSCDRTTPLPTHPLALIK